VLLLPSVFAALAVAVLGGPKRGKAVQQTVELSSSRNFNEEEEPFTIDLYGNIQTGLCIALVPVTIFYVRWNRVA